MAAMTEYLKDKLIRHVLTNTSYSSPATVYLALFTTPPTVGGGGTEVVGGSYARQSLSLTWGGSGTGNASNGSTITFSSMPTCTVVGGAVFDASTSGNMLLFTAATTARSVTSGQDITIPAGDFLASFD